ncbi:MAG: hypothetical protein ABIE22_02895 [archaeon]
MVAQRNQKHVFWQALLVAAFIFSFGILIGALVENSRAGRIDYLYLDSEVSLMDLRLQQDILDNLPVSCESAAEKNMEFADRVYWEARTLEKYDESSKVSDDLKTAHKRYDVLRTMLWYNSIKIKESCGDNFHTIVYLYNYADVSISQKSRQNVFSKMALDLKEKRSSEVLLIPIAADLGVDSLDLLMDLYNVTEIPVIVIDENVKITEIMTVEELEDYFN